MTTHLQFQRCIFSKTKYRTSGFRKEVLAEMEFVSEDRTRVCRILMDNGRRLVSEALLHWFRERGVIHKYFRRIFQNRKYALNDLIGRLWKRRGPCSTRWAIVTNSCGMRQCIRRTISGIRCLFLPAGAKKTSYEPLTEIKPDLSNTRQFGCKALARITKKFRTGKLANQARLALMVGYAGSAAYKLYVSETKSIIVVRDVHMVEYSSDGHWTHEQPDDLYMDLALLSVEYLVISPALKWKWSIM